MDAIYIRNTKPDYINHYEGAKLKHVKRGCLIVSEQGVFMGDHVFRSAREARRFIKRVNNVYKELGVR